MATSRVSSWPVARRFVISGALLFSSLFLSTCKRDATAPSVATRLAFTVQPGTTTAGRTMTPAVRVAAEDESGNTISNFMGDVTVAIGVNPAAGTLTGTVTVTAVNGVAVFYGLSIDKSGAAYTLTATTNGLTAATSAPFDIDPGPATHLAFSVEPTTTNAGATMTPPVQVTALDAEGNVVSSFTGSVTVALGANSAGGALAGTTTVAAVSGAASFPDLSLSKAGTGYSLTAATTGLAAGTSTTFAITPGAVKGLAFTVEPGTTTAGHEINPAVAVKVSAMDALGNVVPGFTAVVAVAITPATDTNGATLTGTTTA